MLGLGLTEILFLVVLGVILVIQYGKPKKNLPPGPRGYPVVGNVFQMMGDAHLIMHKWAKQYGKIYKLQLGSNLTVVINDIKLLKEVMNDGNFANRPYSPLMELLSGGPYGVITTNGRTWEEQRRWSLRKLRDFGFGKTSMEGMIMDEVDEMVEMIRKNGETPMKVDEILDLVVLNALWTLLNGKRMKLNDPKIRDVLNAHHEIPQAITQSGLMFVPWLKYIFPNAQRIIEVAGEKVMNFSREAVKQHWDTYKEGESRDFIDEYIAEIKRTTDTTSSFFGDVGRKNLEAVVSDLIQAGSETTSNTLSWFLCYMTEYQEIQKRVQDEIDAMVGSSKVGLSDKPNLPYTEATILETLRSSSLIAAGVQRSAIEDKKVEGYTIPKDCWVLPNIYHIHHDSAIWGDPSNFRSERFLSPDGKKVIKHEALIPFQLGRRQCLGESLARDTLFLFAANLLQQFKVEKLEKEFPQAEMGGIVLMPKSYHFIFKSRLI